MQISSMNSFSKELFDQGLIRDIFVEERTSESHVFPKYRKSTINCGDAGEILAGAAPSRPERFYCTFSGMCSFAAGRENEAGESGGMCVVRF